ncbi:ABC transporter substrate-binding protein [Azospirillum sp.]|uniref:ABC transporter substrate-binding protein n=1 Tax=Azospirillum sp. TaxID=34012 RepID=UPI002D791751|nr:ABC transporter substrate-binding protein [Azospirillum sp.]
MATAILGTQSIMAAESGPVSGGTVKIAVLTDLSGVNSAASGSGVTEAVRMAVEDFGGKVLNSPIEILTADHQNKTDVGANIANKWLDVDDVDVIVDVPNSAVALAVQDIAKRKGRVFIAGGASIADLTGAACSPTGIHYIYDTYSMAGTAAAAAVQQVGKSYYFLTVDYAFGHAIQQSLSTFLKAAGATIVGGVRHPLGAQDLSSFLLQAQASPAEVIVLVSGGTDTLNAIKTAKEFGITSDKKLLALMMVEPDIHGLGLENAQGMLLPSPFFWSRTPESTAWSRTFFARTGKMPSFIQAGAYSYTMHYLKAIQAAGTDEGKAVVAKMKETPIDDWFAKGTIRPDGRMVHDMYLVRVKAPAASKEPWDYFELVDTIPGDTAFRPMNKGGCPLVDP